MDDISGGAGEARTSGGTVDAERVVHAIAEIGRCGEKDLPGALEKLAASVRFKSAAIVEAVRNDRTWSPRRTVCQSREFVKACRAVLQVVCRSADPVRMFITSVGDMQSESVEETRTYSAAGIHLEPLCTADAKTILLLVTDDRGVTLSDVEKALLQTVGSLVCAALSRKDPEAEDAGPSPEEELTDRIRILGHDLSSPLVSILMCADMLASPPASPAATPEVAGRQDRAIRRIRENSRFMLQLIGDLMDSVSINEGRMIPELRRMDVKELVTACVDRCADRASEKGIKIQVEGPAGPLQAKVDPSKISQVLDNLLNNALKFSNAGSQVTLTVEGIIAAAGPGELRLRVRDQGLGIASGEIGKLFQKFSTTSTRATKGEKSTGLGLYIASEMVKIHGGTLGVESEPGKGSTFTVSLPGCIA